MDIFFDDEIIRIGEDESIIQAFFSHFNLVPAAGGLVKNDQGEILFIFRRGKWDLPKGKVEKNCELRITNDEFIRIESVREVKEETGLMEVEIIRQLESTYHIYQERGEWILKETVWFEMLAKGDQKTEPQTEEEITEVRWFKPEEIGVVLENTFESLKKMIKSNRL